MNIADLYYCRDYMDPGHIPTLWGGRPLVQASRLITSQMNYGFDGFSEDPTIDPMPREGYRAALIASGCIDSGHY